MNTTQEFVSCNLKARLKKYKKKSLLRDKENKFQFTCFPFLIDSHPETNDDNEATDDGPERRFLPENEVRRRHVEDGREGAADVVEGNADVFQTQVVEDDHGHEDDRQGQDLQC